MIGNMNIYIVGSVVCSLCIFCKLSLAQEGMEGAEMDSTPSKMPDGRPATKLNFKPPKLSDEESHSMFMPDNLRCDGCRAVAYQIYTSLRKVHTQNSKKYKGNLPESIILDAFEKTCHKKGVFDSYGIRNMKDVKRLTGPGLPEADEPGIIQGGGKWPSRLHDMCNQFAGELEEENIYAVFRKKPDDLQNFENYLCRGPESGLQGACSKVEGKRAKVEL